MREASGLRLEGPDWWIGEGGACLLAGEELLLVELRVEGWLLEACGLGLLETAWESGDVGDLLLLRELAWEAGGLRH